MTAPSGLSSGLRRCSLPPALGSRAGPDPCWLRSARQGRAAGGQSVKGRTGPTQQPVSMGVRDPCPPAPSLTGWGWGRADPAGSGGSGGLGAAKGHAQSHGKREGRVGASSLSASADPELKPAPMDPRPPPQHL